MVSDSGFINVSFWTMAATFPKIWRVDGTGISLFNSHIFDDEDFSLPIQTENVSSVDEIDVVNWPRTLEENTSKEQGTWQ